MNKPGKLPTTNAGAMGNVMAYPIAAYPDTAALEVNPPEADLIGLFSKGAPLVKGTDFEYDAGVLTSVALSAFNGEPVIVVYGV